MAKKLPITIEKTIDSWDAIADDGWCFEPELHCLVCTFGRSSGGLYTSKEARKELSRRVAEYEKLERCEDVCGPVCPFGKERTKS